MNNNIVTKPTENILLTINGKFFRCECGSLGFNRLTSENSEEMVFECTECHEVYIGKGE